MITGELPAAHMLPPNRGARIRETLARKMDEVFKGHTFDIVEEIHLPKGQVYLNQFGQRGRHGFIIQDRESGERHVVGWHLLKAIHDRYLGVTLPTNPKYKIRKMRKSGELD